MKHAVVFLADGVEECEGLLIVDLLRRAGIDVVTASVMGHTDIHSSHGIHFEADAPAEALCYDDYDIAILPGGGVGTENLRASATVRKVILRYAEENGKWLAAVCAAPTVFAELGLLRDKNATCFPGMKEKMTGSLYTGSPVEVAGNIITGKALGATIPFALEIIAQLLGKDAAKQTAERICWQC